MGSLCNCTKYCVICSDSPYPKNWQPKSGPHYKVRIFILLVLLLSILSNKTTLRNAIINKVVLIGFLHLASSLSITDLSTCISHRFIQLNLMP